MSESKIYAKFLPAEGEIKRGDYNLQTDYSTRSSGKPVVGIWDGDEPPVNNQFMKFQKVEPFAVEQKDLSIGERDFFAMLNRIKPEEQETEFYKILAPLSPNVLWEIQDGAEIEGRLTTLNIDSGNIAITEVFEVKGPCGHYH